ncbi:helix-turn-helix domain-containing protein [Nitrospira sp. M1]
MKDLDKLMTCEEVSQVLGLRVSTIRRMIYEKRIDVVRPTRRAVRIPESSVRKILNDGFSARIPS